MSRTTATDERSSSGDPLDLLAQSVSMLADYGFVVAVVEGLSVLRGRQTASRAAMRLGILGGSIFVLNLALKRLVDRTRPESASTPTGLVHVPTSTSFPSGHTMAAAASAMALPETAAGTAAGLVGAGLVGWSRLHLGAHHRGDVAGGFAIGMVLGGLCRLVFKALNRE